MTKVEQTKYNAWKASIKRKFDMTDTEWLKMLADQNGVCAICGGVHKSGRRLHTDHNHKQAKELRKQGKSIKESVRGLLCTTCNMRLISRLGDRPDAVELFTNASNYLKQHKDLHKEETQQTKD